MQNGRPGARQVLCLSTDGEPSDQSAVANAVQNAQSNGLDRFNVIGVEQGISEQELNDAYENLVFGGGAVTAVEDFNEFAFIVGATCLFADVELLALEVNQSVQDWNNSVSLITGRTTFVRAFIQSKEAPAPVFAKLIVSDISGNIIKEVTSSNLSLFKAPTATNNSDLITARRANINTSLNFRFKLFEPGVYALTLEGIGNEIDCSETYNIDSGCSKTLIFSEQSTPDVKYLKVRYYDSEWFEPTTEDVLQAHLRNIAQIPAPNINYEIVSYTHSGSNYTENYQDADQLLFDLALKRFNTDGCDLSCNQIYQGLVFKNDTDNEELTSSFLTSPSGVAANNPFIGTCWARINSETQNRGRNSCEHEIGHLLNFINHSGCAHPSVMFPETYQITNGGEVFTAIGPMDSGLQNEIWGYDFFTERIVNPNNHFELMSYCGDSYRWISNIAYGDMGNFINQRFDILAINNDDNVNLVKDNGYFKNSTKSPQDYLVINGIVDTTAQLAYFQPFSIVSSDVSFPPVSPGDYTLLLLDDLGNIIEEVSFMPIFSSNVGSTGFFLIPVFYDPAIASIQVIFENNVIAEFTVSENTPEVTVIYPNGGESLNDSLVTFEWSASDLDGDTLTYTVQYSMDGGNTYETLTTNWPFTTFEIPLSNLGMTSQGVIRITASDGFNSSSDTSDGFFITPNNAPTVSMINPDEGATYTGLEPVFFDAVAYDTEDGSLTGSSFVWTSDLDGFLGTGESFSLTAFDMTEGMHVITLTVTDSVGGTTRVSVTINILYFPNIPPLLDIVTPADSTVYELNDTLNVELFVSEIDEGDAITEVTISIDSVVVATFTEPPYTYSEVLTEEGIYQLTATATDMNGGVSTETITYFVGDDYLGLACLFVGVGVDIYCEDMGTDDISDDVFYFTLEPNGDNFGSSYTVSGDVDIPNIPYGLSPMAYGPYPSGTSLDIVLTDDDDSNCTFSTTVIYICGGDVVPTLSQWGLIILALLLLNLGVLYIRQTEIRIEEAEIRIEEA